MKLTSLISHVALVLLLCLVMTASSWGAAVTVDLEQDLQQQQDTSSSNNLAVASSLLLRGTKAPPTPDDLGQKTTKKRYKTKTSIDSLDGPSTKSDVATIAKFSYTSYNEVYYQAKDPVIIDYSVTSYTTTPRPQGRLEYMDMWSLFELSCGPLCDPDEENPFFVVLAKEASGFYDNEMKTTGGNHGNRTALVEAANLAGTQVANRLCENLRKSGIRKFKFVRDCRITLAASEYSGNWEVDELEESSSQQEQENDEEEEEDMQAVLEE